MTPRILALALALSLVPSLAPGDVWHDCQTFREFCKHRHFHRDCVTYGLKSPVKCICVELRRADGSWPRRSCGWTDDRKAPDLTVEYEPPEPLAPCLVKGREACN